MEHVVWEDRPTLKRPVLIAAFEGWNDAGDAATYAARWLAEQWSARQFATIDPEEFFDFSSTRPTVRLDEARHRQIEWPGLQLSAASVPGASVDVVTLIGNEPQLRWRTFCEQVTSVAKELDVRLVITLGALLAEVPHSRPVSIVGTADDDELIQLLDLRRSTYQGPTGIVGVLHDACRREGISSASFWAAVPTYIPGAPSPKAALALVERVAQAIAVPVETGELEIASMSYERQVDELVADDDDTASYVARLEAEADDPSLSEDDDDAEDLIEELERFLRDHPPGT